MAWGWLGDTGSPQTIPDSGSWALLTPPACMLTVLPPASDRKPEQCPTLLREPPTSLQVFEEEHHILYLDHGGVIVAIKDTSIPLKTLK